MAISRRVLSSAHLLHSLTRMGELTARGTWSKCSKSRRRLASCCIGCRINLARWWRGTRRRAVSTVSRISPSREQMSQPCLHHHHLTRHRWREHQYSRVDNHVTLFSIGTGPGRAAAPYPPAYVMSDLWWKEHFHSISAKSPSSRSRG